MAVVNYQSSWAVETYWVFLAKQPYKTMKDDFDPQENNTEDKHICIGFGQPTIYKKEHVVRYNI